LHYLLGNAYKKRALELPGIADASWIVMIFRTATHFDTPEPVVFKVTFERQHAVSITWNP
jgi:hypothetical protein